ncbi:MAG: amino acid dehydrogenase [Bacteroidetes bacterium]|nr:MAG: amino acid dehydrogenase [Bacteroidota bacterium]
MSKQVTIVGGGIIGLCCAYYLRKEGHEVRVIERGDITDGTSFGNAGYVSPSHFVPLASPGIIAKGLRWMLSSTSPFYIKPRFSWDLIKWCMTFWRQANEKTVHENAPHLNNILHLSRELTSQIKNDIGNQFHMEEIGCFMMYKSDATEKHEIELAEEAKQFGIETKILNAQEVQALEPDVEVNVKGGVLYPIDCHLHPGEFMKTLRDHLKKMGITFQLNTTVTGFEKNGDKITSVITDKGNFKTDEIVLATGSWLPGVLNKLGINILLQPGKGYSMTYPNMEKNLRYPAILVDDRVAMTPMGNNLRMGGTMEISGLSSPVLVRRAEAIYNASKKYYPGLNLSFPGKEKIWSGLRPLSPDGLPYIGKHDKYENLVIAGGHAMLGVSLAAGTGKLVEEMVNGKKTSIDVSAFDVTRFGA